MNQMLCDEFFKSITSFFVYEPSFYEYFIRHGFDPSEWPEVSCKSLAVDFHEKAKSNSVEYAKLYLGGKIKLFNSNSLVIPLHESNALIVMFHEYKNFGLHLQLGLSLISSPQNGASIISGFKNHTSTGVIIENLKEKIGDHVENEISILAQGKDKKIIIESWKNLSHMIGGFNPKRVSMIVAGTGVGKTTLCLNILLSAIKTMPALYFNMEMGYQDIYDRICMIGTGTTSDEWGRMSSSVVKKAGAFISDIYSRKDLLITDGRSLTIDQICNEIFTKKDKFGVKLVFVDYDQKIKTKFYGEEWQTIQKAVEALEEVAKQTETHIVVLAQGDDNNQPKASKRSTQPASSVLAFYKNDSGDFVIEATKNRHGIRGDKIKVDCDFSSFQIREIGQYQELPKPIDERIFKNVEKKRY